MVGAGATADYIIVGSGASGSVIAARLSEDPNVRVLLLEAGAQDWTFQTRIPAALMRTLGNPRFDWRLQTEPDPTRNGRADQWSRGRLAGGSTALNGLIFVRGSPADFDHPAWSANPGWSWSQVLPRYRRSESSDLSHLPDRGASGPLPVEVCAWRHPLTDSFIRSAEADMAFNPDINGPERRGIGYCQTNIRRGLRQSSFDAFIRPNLRRSNLRLLTHCEVERISFDGARATGVEARHKGREIVLHAQRGVVVAAGAFHSPWLLMRSGIGPGAMLQDSGTRVLADSPEVGRNLMDHVGVRMPFTVDRATMNTDARLHVGAVHALRWLLTGGGPVGAPSAQAIGFLDRPSRPGGTDLQVTLFPFANKINAARQAVLPPEPYMNVAVNLNYPESRGHLAVARDRDGKAALKIYPRMLDADADVETMLDGMALVRRILQAPPFADHIRRIEYPVTDRAADLAFLRENARSFMHPAGTCRMGPDSSSVVDPKLRVRGAEALWIADASIFPRHLAGNINASVIMVGEMASDLISGRMQ